MVAMDEDRIFAAFPTLATDRLVLRELRDEDAEDAYGMFSDPEVMRYVGKHPHRSLEETRAALARTRDRFAKRDGLTWAITLRGEDRFIGSCCHWRLMKEHLRTEVGYDLLRAHWGRGLVSEALGAILDYGFTGMGLHSTEAQIDPANERSRQVLLRLGFRQEGLLRENFFFDGKFTDTAIFTLLRREHRGCRDGAVRTRW